VVNWYLVWADLQPQVGEDVEDKLNHPVQIGVLVIFYFLDQERIVSETLLQVDGSILGLDVFFLKILFFHKNELSKCLCDLGAVEQVTLGKLALGQ
jgi:hypothetical protein